MCWMHIAVIEDNLAEANSLKNQILHISEDLISDSDIDLYSSATLFLNENRYYDLIMIDCLLPDISGVELAKTIRQTNQTTAFIFTTAYMEYAAEGYETDAMRYLLKPISDEKLKEALICFSKNAKPEEMIELTGTIRNASYVKKASIIYVEYVGRKVIVRLKDGSVESNKPMKAFESELGSEYFFRTSPRFLVNFKHITGKKDNILIMQNGEHVTISRRSLTPFNQAYIKFLKRG